MFTKSLANGHDLLNAFDDAVASHSALADDRAADVNGRIIELEAELTSLRVLQSRLRAATQ